MRHIAKKDLRGVRLKNIEGEISLLIMNSSTIIC